jgi:hypothetical protein
VVDHRVGQVVEVSQLFFQVLGKRMGSITTMVPTAITPPRLSFIT